MKKYQRRSWALFAAFVLFLSLNGCAMHGGEVSGRVVDETGKPLDGVMVVITWEGSVFQIFSSSSACYHVEVARTNSNGYYTTPSWVDMEFLHARISFMHHDYKAYKPGYKELYKKGLSDGTRLMVITPFKGNADEFTKYISRFYVNCIGDKVADAKLVEYHSAILREAENFPGVSKDLYMFDKFRNSIKLK